MYSSMAIASGLAVPLAVRRCALQSLQVFQCECARFEQIGDQQARGATEEIEEVSYQAAAEFSAADGWLEQLSIANFFDFPQGALLFEPVDQCLHGRISDAFVFRQAVEDFPDRRGPEFPELFQDAGFGFGERWFVHVYYFPRQSYYNTRFVVKRNLCPAAFFARDRHDMYVRTI